MMFTPLSKAKLPAHAGVILIFYICDGETTEATRTRGGDPIMILLMTTEKKSYPHTRG